MDRHFLVGMALGMVIASGCSQAPPDTAARPAAAPSAAAVGGAVGEHNANAPIAAQTHRPIIVSSDSLAAAASTPSPASDSPPPPPIEQPRSFAPAVEVDGAKPPVPPDADLALNPLRLSVEPAAVPRENPLREFRIEAEPPRIGIGPPIAAPRAIDVPPGQPRQATARKAAPPSQERAAEGATAKIVAPPAGAQARMSVTIGPPALVESSQYDVVQVLYGTDRQAAVALAAAWPAQLVRFLPTGCSVLIALCLVLVASSRRSLPLALVAFGGAGVSLGLGYQATANVLVALRQSTHQGLRYTTERSPGGHVDLGICEVTIPKTHVTGELEAPSILRLEVREDLARHVALHKTERLADGRFYALLRERVQSSSRKELFVFVHGFNVSFEDAARRTAQVHHDLKFEGAPVFFSWPAHDKFILTYPADEKNVDWSAPHLKRFLLEVAKESGARSINLIAHSMGNRAVAVALREIDLELRGQSKLFNQVILAAPDIDADDFRDNIVPAMQRTAQRLTLYASSRDDALLASQLLHRGPRAGDAGEGLVVVNGVDTIDVTAIDSSPWGHSYYGSSDPVLQDLKLLFTQAALPQQRDWLSPAERNGLTYWVFQPTRTATANTDVSR